uniref:Uncharacterized protein n=1 Tax=Anguilla anguilla TaxID=7936 RepID=A0A0E9VYL9_ANGAN
MKQANLTIICYGLYRIALNCYP